MRLKSIMKIIAMTAISTLILMTAVYAETPVEIEPISATIEDSEIMPVSEAITSVVSEPLCATTVKTKAIVGVFILTKIKCTIPTHSVNCVVVQKPTTPSTPNCPQAPTPVVPTTPDCPKVPTPTTPIKCIPVPTAPIKCTPVTAPPTTPDPAPPTTPIKCTTVTTPNTTNCVVTVTPSTPTCIPVYIKTVTYTPTCANTCTTTCTTTCK